MALHKVHDDGNALLMRSVNQGFQFIGRAASAAGCEEGADVIAEGAIVGMLLNGHYLNAVIAVLDNAREHILTELIVGAHLLGILRHTHVAFINQKRVFAGLKLFSLKHIGVFRSPHLCAENMCLLVLDGTGAICRNTLALSAFPVDRQLVKVAMTQGFAGKFQLPVAAITESLKLILRHFLPVVALSDEENAGSIRSPFAEHPLSWSAMKSEIQMSAGKIHE